MRPLQTGWTHQPRTGWTRLGRVGVSRRWAYPTGGLRGCRFRVRRCRLRWSRLPGPRTPRRPCRLQPPTSTPQTGTPPSRTLQTGQSRRRALLSRPDQIRVRPMRAPQTGARRAGLVGAPRTQVHPMGVHRAGLPRRRRLGRGGPRRLLRRRCLRSRRPAHSGLPRPRPPSNQPNQPSTTSQPNQASRASQFSQAGRANQASRVVSRAGQLSQASQAGRVSQAGRANQASRVVSRAGRASRAGRFGLVGLVCRVGVLLGRAPQVPRGLLPGLRPPHACRPAREQAHLLPRPAQCPRPGRLSRRRVAAPVGPARGTLPAVAPVAALVGAPRGTPPAVVRGMLPVVVLVGAVLTPRPGQRPGPCLVRRRVRLVLPPLAHARGPRIRSRPAWPPPATPNETAP